MSIVKVRDALMKVSSLRDISNNLRLLNQYFLNQSESYLSEIADSVGINGNIPAILETARLELENMANGLEMSVLNIDIEE